MVYNLPMLIDGRQIASEIIESLKGKSDTKKSIGFFLFVENPATRSFIRRKMKVAEDLCVKAELFELLNTTTEDALRFINETSDRFDGVVIQLPLPPHLDMESLINIVPAEKDVDVLSRLSSSDFKLGKSRMVPPVAGAVQKILEKERLDLSGKNIVILGKGKLVGEPVEAFFMRNGFNPTVFDKHDEPDEVMKALKEADIIISGIGAPHFVKPEMVKSGVVLIDAGTSESNGELKGDIDPECAKKSSLMTPVPGGVGPITVAVLFENLFKS